MNLESGKQVNSVQNFDRKRRRSNNRTAASSSSVFPAVYYSVTVKLDLKAVAVNWKKWFWTNYEVTLRLNAQSGDLRTAILLSSFGPDVPEIYYGLPFANPVAKTQIDKVIETLDSYFIR